MTAVRSSRSPTRARNAAATTRRAGRPGRPPGARGQAGAVPTRERILESAERLFEERGYHATSLTEIARESGIRTPSLLHHFKSREELLDEILRRFYSEGRERIVLALASGGTAESRMVGVVQAVREIWRRQPGLVRLALGEAFRPDGIGRAHISEIAVPLVQWVANVLRESGDQPIPSEAPAQGALMLALSGELVRVALGELGDELWGADRGRWDEVEGLLLRGLSAWTAGSAAAGGVFRPAGGIRARALKRKERKS